MNKQEEILKQALEKITPDVWDSIVLDLREETREAASSPEKLNDVKLAVVDGGKDEVENQETVARGGKSINAKAGKRTPWYMQLALVAAAFVLVIGGIWGFNYGA